MPQRENAQQEEEKDGEEGGGEKQHRPSLGPTATNQPTNQLLDVRRKLSVAEVGALAGAPATSRPGLVPKIKIKMQRRLGEQFLEFLDKARTCWRHWLQSQIQPTTSPCPFAPEGLTKAMAMPLPCPEGAQRHNAPKGRLGSSPKSTDDLAMPRRGSPKPCPPMPRRGSKAQCPEGATRQQPQINQRPRHAPKGLT